MATSYLFCFCTLPKIGDVLFYDQTQLLSFYVSAVGHIKDGVNMDVHGFDTIMHAYTPHRCVHIKARIRI